MNTPSHVAASVLVWRGEERWGTVAAVVCGALLPDLPMFGFYGYQRWWAGRSERQIWSQLYFQEDWQLLFDLFNSIPLAIALLILFRRFGFRWGALCAASALLHMLCDLPLHHDDAHRHFLPLSGWRFASPVSYWDPRHFGIYAALAELIFAVGACGFVAWKGKSRPIRITAMGTLAMYALGFLLALVLWVW